MSLFLRWRELAAVAALVALGPFAMADGPSDPSAAPAGATAGAEKPEPPPLSPEGQRISKQLDESLPADSEARRMYEAIMAGSQLGPGEGWFGDSQAATRFTWDNLQQSFDANGDEQIGPYEFPGEAEDFHRLDRNQDGAVTQADLAWPDHALMRSPGLMLFMMLDRDANGRVTREEFDGMFDAFDRERLGFLALDDMKDRFSPPPRPESSSQPADPSRETLLRGLLSQEIGSQLPGPGLGEIAPTFALRALNNETIDLSSRIGVKPIVLVFGNFTCGPFRGQAGNIEKLYRRYSDRVDFLMIYVREAHPLDGWRMESNDRAGIGLPQPKTDDERRSVAQTCQAALDFEMPFLVDTIDDAVGAVYSGMPSRLYLIDYAGKIAFKSGRGPFGFKPAELEQSLIWLLAEPAPPSPEPGDAGASSTPLSEPSDPAAP